MKVKQIVGVLEHTDGRKSHKYLMNLLNDGLDEIAQISLNNLEVYTTSLEKGKRWYGLNNVSMIDVTRVEVKTDEDKWRMIPRISGDIEIGDES